MYLFIHERHREREREREAETQAEGEAGFPLSGGPDAGLDPRTSAKGRHLTTEPPSPP